MNFSRQHWPPHTSHTGGEYLTQQSKPSITRTTHTLPFDKLSPRDFERLCLWLVEREGYECAEHPGAAGSKPLVNLRGVLPW